MLEAIIFDLDGTLVQTEKLKAISYARAAVELAPGDLSEAVVIEAFKDVVGRSRQEVAQALLERFELEQPAAGRMAEFRVGTPWQAFVQVRLRHYGELTANPAVIRDHRWPHTLALLDLARRARCKLGLATMSRCEQANHVLDVLGLTGAFDVVASRDDVENGKPDPEIYLLAARMLDVLPAHTLVVEDSPSGVQAALAAEMQVVAVATPFTREPLQAQGLLPPQHIALEPDDLLSVVSHVVEHIQGDRAVGD